MKYLSLLAPLVAVVGCGDAKPKISCTTDAQCTLANRPGVCIEGSCAVADSSCPSGYRYDTMAGGSGDCVIIAPGTDLSVGDDMETPIFGDMAMPPDMTMVDFAFIPMDMAGSNDTPLTWTSKTGGNSATDYKAVYGASAATDVYTVGNGTLEIVHFYNGSVITGTQTGRLNSVWETPTGTGYAVGVSGTIVELTNGGSTQLAQTSGTMFELSALWGSGTTMYAGGEETILMTTNSGGAWSAGTGLAAEVWLQGISGTSTDVWAVGFNFSGANDAPVIYHTTVGSNAWTAQTVPSLTNVRLFGVYAVSATEIYAVGDAGTILKSAGDGTWTQISATTTTNGLYGIGSDGSGGVIAVGNAGTILHKFANNATAFFGENSGVPTEQLFGVWGAGANNVYVVGQAGTILHGQ